MGKRALKERAGAYSRKLCGEAAGEFNDARRACALSGYIAGHRANRISAAERRVVEAAKAIIKNKRKDGSYMILTVDCVRLAEAFEKLKRAKGGANG